MNNTKKMKILIVDDDSFSRRFLTKILGNVGYAIKEATCGKEALEKAKIENPNLIILAVELPDITGYEVCKQLKLNPDTEIIPILNITEYYTENKDYVHGLECGADNYLIKPIDPHVLIAIVSSMLRIQNTESNA